MKLLTEQELRKALYAAILPGNGIDDLVAIVQSQKIAHADMVIGEDTPYGTRGKYPIEIEVENDLRAEQRERNK